jgi:hypothetical protein
MALANFMRLSLLKGAHVALSCFCAAGNPGSLGMTKGSAVLWFGFVTGLDNSRSLRFASDDNSFATWTLVHWFHDLAAAVEVIGLGMTTGRVAISLDVMVQQLHVDAIHSFRNLPQTN